MLKDSLFYAKILLFGEYGVIHDSMGLSIPYNSYKGSLKFESEGSEGEESSNQHLRSYLEYLKSVESEHLNLDLKTFGNDIDNGLYFDSSIPQGFGVGSSGALVAAVYNKYAINPILAEGHEKRDIATLKEVFAIMESYFHGKSSGLDPLICYLNLPVLIKSKDDLGTVGLPQASSEGKGAIFLVDSGSPGSTQPMVNIFMEKMKNQGFRKMLREEFKKYNDACIQAFLKRDVKPLFSNIKQLSRLLLENFTPMIPHVFHKLWKEGIESNDYYLKLCGSGGGGYVLGFTEDIDKAKQKLKDYQLEVVFTF